MSPSRLKNIVLLILLLANLLLLGQVVLRERQSAQYRRAALTDALTILADSGIAVAWETVPPEPLPPALQTERDPAAEAAAAAALLGAEAVSDGGGGAVVTTYHAPTGTLRFYGDGYFAAELAAGAYPAGDTPLGTHAAELAALLGVTAAVTETGEDSVTLTQTLAGRPVFSCTLRAVYRDGSLVSLSGTRAPGTPRADGTAGLSPATLLLRFRTALRERGDVCSEILAIEPGYTLSASFTGAIRLLPTLRLTIDGSRVYLLDIQTGELRAP